MGDRMLRKLLALLALLSWIGVAHAGDKPLYGAAPAWVKPAPPIDGAKLTDDDPAFLMFDQQQKLQDGQAWAYYNLATRIASNQMLMQAGTVQLPWAPDQGDLTVHAVEIIRGSEHIDVLAGGARFTVLQREQQLEQSFMSGMLTATMAVEGLRVGDVLRVSFSVTRKDPAMAGNVQTIAPIMAAPMRIGFGRFRLLWPATSDLRWRTYATDPGVVMVEHDGFKDLTIALPVAKQPDMPNDAPARFLKPPIIEASSYPDWIAVSRQMAPLYKTEGAIPPGSPLAGEVARIAAASADPRVRAAMALQLVQDKVRYLFKGMDDGNYVPQTPVQTWTLRYGDCKAKSLLLLSILRALGIDAEATLTSISAGDLIASRLPMPGAFDHVIVHANIGGKGLWLDGTSTGSRLVDLDDTPPFRNALPLRLAGSDLIPIPPRANARPEAEVDIDLDETAGITFPAPFKVSMRMRGGMAEMLRTASAAGGKEQADSMVDTMISGYLGNNLTTERSIKFDEATGTAMLTASGIAYSRWTKDDEHFKVQVDTAVDGITFAPDRARPAWKDIPVTSGGASDKLVRTHVRLPGGAQGFAFEGDQTLPPALAGTILSRTSSIAGGVATTEERIITGVNEVAPADIPAARRQVAQAKTRLLKLTAPADYPSGPALVASAKRTPAYQAILAVYAKRIADKPQEADSYTGRAWFMGAVYDRPAAIRDLDKAIAIAPTAETYAWRATLYTATGDDKKAVADLNAALQLDPASASAISQLATLRTNSGDVDGGLTLISEQIDNGGKDKNGFISTEADLLGRAGRTDEGLAALDKAITASPGDPSLLNSRCWLKGTRNVALDTALRDCTKAIELSDSPSNALDSRGMVYFRMGRMDDATADFNAALDKDPEQSSSLFMRGVIRKRAGDNAGSAADLAAARMIQPRVDEDYARYGIRP